jgi:hypothetical protein
MSGHGAAGRQALAVISAKLNGRRPHGRRLAQGLRNLTELGRFCVSTVSIIRAHKEYVQRPALDSLNWKDHRR